MTKASYLVGIGGWGGKVGGGREVAGEAEDRKAEKAKAWWE